MPPPLPPAKSHFKNKIGNPFFDFFKYWPKRSKFFFRILIWTLTCFKNTIQIAKDIFQTLHKVLMVNHGFYNGKKINELRNYILDTISVPMSLNYTQNEENSIILGVCFLTGSWFFSISLINLRCSILAILIELHYNGSNRKSWFLEEMLKNQLKVRKHTPQNVAILFNLSTLGSLEHYFVQNIISKFIDFFPIIKAMIHH